MKISAKTLKAASRAAEARGMSLDRWADEVLAAAAASGHPSRIEAHLREISEKIDRIADRQSLGEKASEQLAGAVQEMGSSYRRVRESAGQVMSEAESRTSSAVEEMTARARDLIDRASKSASELFGTLVPRSGSEGEAGSATAPTNVRASRVSKKSRAKSGTKTAGNARRRSGAKNTVKSGKPRGSQRRRSAPKSRS